RKPPPASSAMPRRTNTSMKRASSAAPTRSHAYARCAPSPAATPFTAATTGFSRSQSARMTRWLGRIASRVAPGCGGPAAPVAAREPERSAPVQKPFPVPVSTTARISGSSPQRASAARYASRISAFMAFRASGRLRTTHPTPFSTRKTSDCVSAIRPLYCAPRASVKATPSGRGEAIERAPGGGEVHGRRRERVLADARLRHLDRVLVAVRDRHVDERLERLARRLHVGGRRRRGRERRVERRARLPGV